MSTSSTTTTAGYTLWIDWNETIVDDATWSFQPVIYATSSQARRSTNISSTWQIDVDNTTQWSGSESTLSYQGPGGTTTTGPVAVDAYSTRTITRIYGQDQTVRLYERFTDWYAGSYGYPIIIIDKSITVPARVYQLPAAPTNVSASRVSDSSIVLSWTNNPTSTAPYTSIIVQRSDENGAWATVATVAGTSTGYTDTSVTTDGSYTYRLAAVNSAGTGSYSSTAGPVLTSPSAPGTPTATKVSATSVALSFTNPSTIATSLEVRRSSNDGATWTTIDTVYGIVTSYTDTSAPAATIVYSVRNAAGGLYSPWSAKSNALTVLAEPYAPSILTAINAPKAIGPTARLDWRFNSADGSSQTKFEVEYSTDNGSTWTSTGQVTSGNEYYPLTTTGFSDGDVILWHVRAWGLYASPSPWSSDGSIIAYDAPTVSIVDPTTDPYTLTSLPLYVEWSFSDTSPRIQTSATVRIVDSGNNVVASKTVYGTGDNVYMDGWQPTNLQNYDLTVTVTSSSGLQVSDGPLEVDVNYNAPAIPSCTITEGDGKSLSITVHEGTSTGSELPTDTLAVYRIFNGESTLLADGMADGDSVVDYLPPMDEEVIYQIVALSSTNLYSTYDAPYTLASHGWLVFNYGNAWSEAVAVKYNVKYSEQFEDDGELWYGAGAADPVLIIGGQRSKAMSASGVVLSSDLPAIRAFADGWHKPSYVRAPGGLKAKVRATVSIDSPHTLYADVSVDMRRLA